MMRGKPGYEHLNEPLHILVEGELPVEIVDARLMQAREILEDLLKPVVISLLLFSYLACKAFFFFCLPYKLTSSFSSHNQLASIISLFVRVNFCFSSFHVQDESQDYYKKQQLRELAMLNGTLREEGSPMSGSVSPFNNSLGMKRAKTRG